eukprot:gene10473-3213_t
MPKKSRCDRCNSGQETIVKVTSLPLIVQKSLKRRYPKNLKWVCHECLRSTHVADKAGYFACARNNYECTSLCANRTNSTHLKSHRLKREQAREVPEFMSAGALTEQFGFPDWLPTGRVVCAFCRGEMKDKRRKRSVSKSTTPPKIRKTTSTPSPSPPRLAGAGRPIKRSGRPTQPNTTPAKRSPGPRTPTREPSPAPKIKFASSFRSLTRPSVSASPRTAILRRTLRRMKPRARKEFLTSLGDETNSSPVSRREMGRLLDIDQAWIARLAPSENVRVKSGHVDDEELEKGHKATLSEVVTDWCTENCRQSSKRQVKVDGEYQPAVSCCTDCVVQAPFMCSDTSKCELAMQLQQDLDIDYSPRHIERHIPVNVKKSPDK